MRGLRRRIEAIIEEVNHEIRVDLGLEEPNPELETIDTLNTEDDLPEITQEESEEAIAFEKVLDEISQRYDNERMELNKELEEQARLEALEDLPL